MGINRCCVSEHGHSNDLCDIVSGILDANTDVPGFACVDRRITAILQAQHHIALLTSDRRGAFFAEFTEPAILCTLLRNDPDKSFFIFFG